MPTGNNGLHEVFSSRARESPDRIAVSAADRQITYGELDERADRLARRLAELGAGPEMLVGLCADRGIEMIVGMLAILKAGAAYLPIDPAYPARRIQLLLGDSAASIVLSTPRAAQSLAQSLAQSSDGCAATVVLLEGLAEREERGRAAPSAPAAAAPHVEPENLAYAIYTSGSTGTPKGVLVDHRNLVRLFEETRDLFQPDERDVWTLFHSISFDFSVWEIWGALLHGGRLVIVPSEVTRSPLELQSLLRAQDVTVLCQTPSAFRQLMTTTEGADQAPANLPLRLVVFAGEALEVRMLEPWIARYGDRRPALINGYGITETTVFITFRRILEADLRHPEVSPIGTPIPDLETRLLDASGNEAPDGTPGEICIAGPGLARGYLNRPDLTAERFVPGPDGGRLYRSGDQALRVAGGELVYLGRADDQIKVRGFRVEPREIEACLLGHPGVATAILLQQDYGEGDTRLTACVLPRAGRELAAREVEELAAALAERAAAELPAHLRPSAYRVVSEIPMTLQGKVDRQALRQILREERAPGDGAAAPQKTTEQAIQEIVEDALERRGIGLHDDLFDAGGTSMTFIRILRWINQRFDLALNGSELGDEATVARLAQCVDAMRQTDPLAITENPK